MINKNNESNLAAKAEQSGGHLKMVRSKRHAHTLRAFAACMPCLLSLQQCMQNTGSCHGGAQQEVQVDSGPEYQGSGFLKAPCWGVM